MEKPKKKKTTPEQKGRMEWKQIRGEWVKSERQKKEKIM